MDACEINWKYDACPFLKFPLADCYCLKIEKQNIDLIMQFCASDYLHCDFFLARMTCLEGFSIPAARNQKPCTK